MDWLSPADADALADLLARRAGGGARLIPTGAGDAPPALPDAPSGRPADGDTSDPDLAALSTASLAGIRELRPRDLTVAAGAGTRVADLLTSLAGEGVWVPLGGPALGMSVGGVVAAAPAGPFDESYGNLKRQLLACHLVAWDGEALRWGRAVMKDVAGYSMVRSVAGSHGRTGVVHRATFRLWPAPESLAAPRLLRRAGEEDALPLAGMLATSDADASVRPDAAVWRWSREAPEGGRLEVRLVGSEASVALRLEKLRGWAADRDAGLEGGEPRPFDPLAAGGAPVAAGARGEAGEEREGGGRAGTAPGPAAAGRDREPAVSVLAIRTGREGFEATARRARGALGEDAVALEGYPLAGHLRCAYRRAPGAGRPSGPPPPGGPFGRLLEVLGDAAVRVERGSAEELEACEGRRSEGARRLEARVLEELGGRPRHWLSAYL